MTNRVLILLIAIYSLSISAISQNIEKINFDGKDSEAGYYLAVRPQDEIKGVLVLLSSFLPPEGILPETKLHNVAYVNGLLTVVASSKQKLYADSSAIARISIILKDIVNRFKADESKFVLAGYDEAGMIVLRYTELTYENPSQFPVQPKVVFAIDSHVDLFGLWHWSANQIKKNYYQGSVGDAKYYIDEMTKNNGTINDHPEKYQTLTPFNRQDEKIGNEKHLKTLPVRLYYDTDIEWQLKNRRNSYYDSKIPDGSELIKRLLLLGNEKAEFRSAKQAGMRSNGIRNPNSISIVDEVECIQWIKQCLKIFDPNHWNPPYKLSIPENWAVEHFELPPGFAPTMNYKGVEDLRFTPGWAKNASEEYWSYAYLWWLNGSPKLDANTLQNNLTAYYTGLVESNIVSRKIPTDKQVPTTATVKKIKTAPGDMETFNGDIHMLDYMTQKSIVLNLMIHIKNCGSLNHTAVFIEISPQPFTHSVWQQFNKLEQGFQCGK
ncbi:MAG: hypothetical protein ACHQNT_14195 [Bacteroidia bacterium]